MNENRNAIVRDILQSALDDWMYFAEVVGIVRQHCVGQSHEHALALSLDTLQEMFDQGLLVPGDLDKSNPQSAFIPWSIPRKQWCDELNRRLLQCQNNPGVGDVCWLTNTPKGDAEVQGSAAS